MGSREVSDHAETAASLFEALVVSARTLPSPESARSCVRPQSLVALAASEPSAFQTCTTCGRLDWPDEMVASREPSDEHDTRYGDVDPARRSVTNRPPAFASEINALFATEPSIWIPGNAHPGSGY